jgi:hypothetical protein
MKLKQRYEIVRKCINELDPMGLIALGCPDDEYEPEILKILPRIPACRDAAELAGIIAEIFRIRFSEDFIAEDFAEEAEIIIRKAANG